MAIIGPFDFRGGYSPGYSFMTLPDQSMFATDMQNCRFSNGAIVPRWAPVTVNSATLNSNVAFISGLKSWIDTVNSKTALVAIAGGSKIFTADATTYQPNGSAIVFTDHTGTSGIGGGFNTNYYTFDSLNNILVGTGNSAAGVSPFKITAYNTDAAPLGGTPPKGDCVKQVNNFLFLSRDLSSTSNQSIVRWSNVNDPETWTATNTLNFNKNDGEPIMALGSIGTDLYIFKQTSIGRLSTVTTATSGGVTLGPLTTVVKGIGCAGPRALDNLPNGNIIFVGFNGHVYEFDGSTPLDLSKQTFPGPDVYSLPETTSIAALSLMNLGDGVVVKVWKGMGEAWISTNGNIPNGPTYHALVWDYNQRMWQGYSTEFNIESATTIQLPQSTISSNILEANEVLFQGSTSGNVLARGTSSTPYPINSGGTVQNILAQTTIHFANQATDFVPRSLLFTTSQTTSSGATLASFQVLADYDTRIPSTQVYSSSGQLPPRVVVGLGKLKQDSVGSNVLPSYLSIQFVGTGSGSGTNNEILRLGQFWLSDEIMR